MILTIRDHSRIFISHTTGTSTTISLSIRTCYIEKNIKDILYERVSRANYFREKIKELCNIQKLQKTQWHPKLQITM
jgi:hypothetical protein